MPAKKSPAKKSLTKKSPAKKSPRKSLTSRLPALLPETFTPAQQALIDRIRSGPRGQATQVRGPFAVFMHAPDYGQLAQELGGFCRLKTRVPPRLSEFAILATARIWRSHYEWFAHAGHAERAGVSPKTIQALRAGRLPRALPKDERAVYDFIKELYRDKRVADRTYGRLHAFLGDEGMVEFVGILGYYVLVAMSLNVFRMGPPAGEPLPFRE
jgi:4-carboxymuconolactone decarboxylase